MDSSSASNPEPGLVEFRGVVELRLVLDWGTPPPAEDLYEFLLADGRPLPEDFCAKDKRRGEQRMFYCLACGCEIKSVISLRDHVPGAKHSKKALEIKRLAWGEESKPMQQPREVTKQQKQKVHEARPISQLKRLTLEERLKEQAGIEALGLMYITEFVSERNPSQPRMYTCSLSDCKSAWGSSNDMFHHLTGPSMKHQKNYLVHHVKQLNVRTMPKNEVALLATQQDQIERQDMGSDRDYKSIKIVKDEEKFTELRDRDPDWSEDKFKAGIVIGKRGRRGGGDGAGSSKNANHMPLGRIDDKGDRRDSRDDRRGDGRESRGDRRGDGRDSRGDRRRSRDRHDSPRVKREHRSRSRDRNEDRSRSSRRNRSEDREVRRPSSQRQPSPVASGSHSEANVRQQPLGQAQEAANEMIESLDKLQVKIENSIRAIEKGESSLKDNTKEALRQLKFMIEVFGLCPNSNLVQTTFSKLKQAMLGLEQKLEAALFQEEDKLRDMKEQLSAIREMSDTLRGRTEAKKMKILIDRSAILQKRIKAFDSEELAHRATKQEMLSSIEYMRLKMQREMDELAAAPPPSPLTKTEALTQFRSDIYDLIKSTMMLYTNPSDPPNYKIGQEHANSTTLHSHVDPIFASVYYQEVKKFEQQLADPKVANNHIGIIRINKNMEEKIRKYIQSTMDQKPRIIP